jgi:2-keto-4-pentenoate hydratase
VDESPSKYLDLANATLIGENPTDARFRVPVRPEVQRLLAVENIDVVITVDKQTGNIAGIGAVLRQPIRVLLGVARITDLDVDLRINPVEGGSSDAAENVEPGSTARVKMSKLGRPVEYDWSDFRRVASFSGS